MDVLEFDAKRGVDGSYKFVALCKEDLLNYLNGNVIEAHLIGGVVNVTNEDMAEYLHDVAGIGCYLDENKDDTITVSRKCFTYDENFFNEIEANKWIDLKPSSQILMLTPEETILLCLEWKVLKLYKTGRDLKHEEVWKKMSELYGDEFFKGYCAYRHLKINGWCVRSGIMFGCDYLVYALGPQYYHSSAGVLVCAQIDPIRMMTLTRILSHNKKGLLLLTCEKPDHFAETFENVERVVVRSVTCRTNFLERKVAQISNEPNELYTARSIID